MSETSEQTKAIYATWKKSRLDMRPLSYTQIGRRHGVTRNVVAGAVNRCRERDGSMQRPSAER